jgi:hypothetical protein
VGWGDSGFRRRRGRIAWWHRRWVALRRKLFISSLSSQLVSSRLVDSVCVMASEVSCVSSQSLVAGGSIAINRRGLTGGSIK